MKNLEQMWRTWDANAGAKKASSAVVAPSEPVAPSEAPTAAETLENRHARLCALLQEYLALSSLDGRPERQALRSQLRSFLDSANESAAQ